MKEEEGRREEEGEDVEEEKLKIRRNKRLCTWEKPAATRTSQAYPTREEEGEEGSSGGG